MSRYRVISDVQQICLNGHQITDSYNSSGSHKQFCPTCGEKTITNCPKCSAFIQGRIITMDTGYDVIASSIPASVPLFCDNCGASFPWRDKIESIPKDEQKPKKLLDHRKIFIVHGHNEKLKDEVESFLQSLDLDPIILHKQVNLGKTIIEKVEHHSDVGFAVILLTCDDFGGSIQMISPCKSGVSFELVKRVISNPSQMSTFSKKESQMILNEFNAMMKETFINCKLRARQNVIFEFGFFIGKLGREKVATLCEEGIERHSDIDGLVYTSIDSQGIWKKKLAQEINAAGIEIDQKYL